jgi:hypothetical protein
MWLVRADGSTTISRVQMLADQRGLHGPAGIAPSWTAPVVTTDGWGWSRNVGLVLLAELADRSGLTVLQDEARYRAVSG